MGNSKGLIGSRRRCSHLAQFSVMVFLVLLFTLAATVNSQTDLLNYCGFKPCIKAVRMSCEEMIELYEFQGSCCSLDTIPATGGCRLTVSVGNCFYYPWCGECDEEEEERTQCNKIFETGAEETCPDGVYNPLAIQSAENFTAPSCAPSMAPDMEAESGSSTTNTRSLVSLVMTATVGLSMVIVAFVAA